jgi:putative nucleotidyltransferase with HDIG domain
MAELIEIADNVDVANHLQRVRPERLSALRETIAGAAGSVHTRRAAGALLDVLDQDMLLSLGDEHIVKTSERFFRPWYTELEDRTLISLGELAARIIDLKSAFTKRHTSGIANKALLMARHYGFGPDERMRFFLAASLHDIGKLATPTAILEKPGSLTDEEFQTIKDHARYTWEMLKDIEGLEQVCDWASNHHEKLNGSGYPFGKKAEALDRNSRLLCCIDIYQAVSEERPYHSGRGHGETIAILREMAERGFVDSQLVRDLDTALAEQRSL